MLRTLLLFCLPVLVMPLKAQDIHFSMFDMAPLSLNPAHTGAFYGTYRVGGIYRDQWASFLPGQFTTPSFYIDAPVLVVRKRDWVGVGAMFYSDRVGTPQLSRTTYQLSASYHLALDKKARNILTLGVQGGQISWNFNQDCGGVPCYGDEIDASLGGGGLGAGSTLDALASFFPLSSSSPGGGNNDRGKSYFDFQTGLLFKSQVNKETDFSIGVAVLHLGNSSSVIANKDTLSKANRIPQRVNAHAQLNMALTDKFTLTPQILYTRMGPASEAVLQAWGTYLWDPQKQISLRAGLGYRFSDAAEVLLGIDYKDFRVGVSYDVNVSSLKDATRFRGGFEAAVSYIGKIYKKPKVKPAVICPKF